MQSRNVTVFRNIRPARRVSPSYGRTALFLCLVMLTLAPLSGQTVTGTITKAGLDPTAMVIFEAGNRLFVADKASGNLYMFDGTTLEELNAVHLDFDWVIGMVIDETYGKLYAADYWLVRKIAVIDAWTGALIRYIEGLDIPGQTPELAIDQEIHKVYASFRTTYQIDVATDAVTVLPVTDGIADIELNPVTHEVFLCGYQGDRLNIINGLTLAHTTIPDLQGWGVGVNPLENKVYLCYFNMGEYHDTIAVYDRDDGSLNPLPVANDAVTITFNPASNRMYTSAEINAVASIIDGSSDEFFTLPLDHPTARPDIRFATNHVYYTGMDYIGVLDDATQLLAVIPVTNPLIAVNQGSGRIYVHQPDLKQVNFFILQDQELITRPPVYVATTHGDDIYLLDPLSKRLANPLPGPPWGFPYLWDFDAMALAVRPGGGRLYVPSQCMGFVCGISTYAGSGTYACLDTFETGGSESVSAVITPAGDKLYLTNSGSDNVSVIDVDTQQVMATLPVGDTPLGAAVSPDGAGVYVTNLKSGTVSVIDTSTDTVAGTLPVGARPWGIAVNPAGTKVFVANSGAGNVAVIDTGTSTVRKTISVGNTPRWLAVTPDGRQVWVSNYDSGTVSVIDTASEAVIRTVTLGGRPDHICAFPFGGEVYVAHGPSVAVIDTGDYSVLSVDVLVDKAEGNVVSLAVADPTARVAGRITIPDKAVSAAVVRALRQGVERGRAITDAWGDYAVTGLPPGTYDVIVHAACYMPSITHDVTATAGVVTLHHVSLSPTPLLFADLDQSDRVRVNDLAILHHYLAGNLDPGTPPFTVPPVLGDLNLDGTVDAQDLLIGAHYLGDDIASLPLL
ncbi:MAG: beta-propeller fold lactonase family protein [Acidobacteria bacterium]|nr:beta-propeller fold lactonase family protein [Acidobacteriota bacterium]